MNVDQGTLSLTAMTFSTPFIVTYAYICLLYRDWDARKVKEAIIDEARLKANEEANRIIENARESIQYEKMAAINELKNQIASISIEIAEKLIGEELVDKDKQHLLTEKLLKEVKIN